MKLLIVESPNKIKKIRAALGSGWEVGASVGHIRDLPTKELGIDKAQGYKMGYSVYEDKKEVVAKLQRLVGQAGKEQVYLATDPDREGEAIAYHLCQELGLDLKTTKRITFQEITESAIRAALAAPRLVDLKLVAAQESRRAIDRLVGFQVSPVLWRKLESGLSAGRVQSVATRLCVAREREIQGFAERFTFAGNGVFITPKGEALRARRVGAGFADEGAARAYLAGRVGKTYRVQGVTTEPVSRAPQPAYSTAGLQQDGVKKLKMSVKRVAEVAQRLFEAGHITYIRTDSVNLGVEARAEAKAQILSAHGPAYHQERTFQNKEGAQEAHEAIRPTHWESRSAGDTDEERQLYALIYARALASQMTPARFDQTTIDVQCNEELDAYTSRARVQTFEGYLAVYQEAEEEGEGSGGTAEEEETEDGVLRFGIAGGDELSIQQLDVQQRYARPPKRYSEATLVAELERKQIGRPSTYASILGVIQTREYVTTGNEPGKKVAVVQLTYADGAISARSSTQTLGADRAKLLPSACGIKLTTFLEKTFPVIVDYEFTAGCEARFDEVAAGRESYRDLVPAFDADLLRWIADAQAQYPDLAPAEQRLLGSFEDNPVTVGTGKFGTFVLHAGIHYSVGDLKPAAVTLAAALEAIARKRAGAVRVLGTYDGGPISTGKNERGGYVVWEKQYFSLAADQDPATLTRDEAIIIVHLVRAKKYMADQRPPVATVGKYTVREGEKGLFVTDGKEQAPLHKSMTKEQAQALTGAQCKSILKKFADWKKANPLKPTPKPAN